MTTRHGPADGGAARTAQVSRRGSSLVRHDGATDAQAARYVTDYVAGRERVGRRPMTVADVSRVLAALVGGTPPAEPSAAWCPRCQLAWQDRVDMYPRVTIRVEDLSWSCAWCGRTAGPVAEVDR